MDLILLILFEAAVYPWCMEACHQLLIYCWNREVMEFEEGRGAVVGVGIAIRQRGYFDFEVPYNICLSRPV